jgi:hypothetical protein
MRLPLSSDFPGTMYPFAAESLALKIHGGAGILNPEVLKFHVFL